MKRRGSSLFILGLAILTACNTKGDRLILNDPVEFSQRFLYAVKSGEPYTSYLDTIATLDGEKLQATLDADSLKLAFWINTYNSLVQIRLKEQTAIYRDKEKFFDRADIPFSRDKISLNQIENCILLNTEKKGNCSTVKEYQVRVPDYRVHFALNCGASACPAIAFYSSEKINEELESAEEVFISGSSTYNPKTNVLTISELFVWYEDDFGGKKGTLRLMKDQGIIPDSVEPVVLYIPYDWRISTENFR